MACVNHFDRNGVNTCCQCGEWLCEACSIDVDDKIVCKTCIAKNIGKQQPVAKPAARPASRPYYSGIILVILAFVPPFAGIGYMYMGLIKRGLFAMSAVFGIIYVLASVPRSGLLALLFPIIWFACLFDTLEKKRLLNSGVHVRDDVGDIVAWIKKYKIPLFLVTVFFFASGWIRGFGAFMRGNAFFGFSHNFSPWPLIGLCIGGYFIIQAIGHKKNRDKNDHDHDYRN